jgi:hypothetical protein
MRRETAPNVSSFFESYRSAFERLDAPGIAEHFAFPLYITSDAEEIRPISVTSKQDWIANVERLVEMYRRIGFASARVLDLTTIELSPRLVQAILQWGLYDGEQRTLYEFQAGYTIAEINGDLRITAIAHDEVTRYRQRQAL